MLHIIYDLISVHVMKTLQDKLEYMNAHANRQLNASRTQNAHFREELVKSRACVAAFPQQLQALQLNKQEAIDKLQKQLYDVSFN